MMKQLYLACICFGFISSLAGGATLEFQNYFDYIYTMDSTVGTPEKVDSSDNWVYALYWDQSANGPDAYGSTDDKAVYVNNSWNASYDGILPLNTASDDDIMTGEEYFLRVYNSSDWTTSDVGSATHFVNLDMLEDNDGTTYANYDATRTFEGTDTTPDSWAGNSGEAIGGSDPDGSDWQVIPEPSTFMLLGLGLATVLARRKLRK